MLTWSSDSSGKLSGAASRHTFECLTCSLFHGSLRYVSDFSRGIITAYITGVSHRMRGRTSHNLIHVHEQGGSRNFCRLLTNIYTNSRLQQTVPPPRDLQTRHLQQNLQGENSSKQMYIAGGIDARSSSCQRKTHHCHFHSHATFHVKKQT